MPSIDIELANLRLASSPEIQIRRTQAQALKDKFLKTLRRYQSSESEARKKYQGRMERQYRIGKKTRLLDCLCDDRLLYVANLVFAP